MNILLHNFVSLVLKKYFRKYKDLGINIYSGQIAIADAELETNNLSFLLASVFQNLNCQFAHIAELKVSIPWGSNKSSEGSIFAKGVHIKLESSELVNARVEKENHVSPVVTIGAEDTQDNTPLFANIRKNVVIVLRDLCIEIALTEHITAKLNIEYVKIMPFLSQKCKVTLQALNPCNDNLCRK